MFRLQKSSRQVLVEDWPRAKATEPEWVNTIDFPMINEEYSGYKNR